MGDNQDAGPSGDNRQTGVEPGQGGSVLTGDQSTASGGDQSLTQDAATKTPPAWMAQLPPDLKGDESLTKFPSIGELGKSYKELEGKLGKSVVLPGEDASEEDRARFYESIGRPEKSSDYKLGEVQLPEGLTVDEGMRNAFLEVAHKRGLSNDQADGLYQWYMKSMGEQLVAAQKFVKTTTGEADAALRKEYGADYEKAKSFMDRGFKEFGTELGPELDRTGLGNHPAVIKMFIKMGKAIGEHGFVEGDTHSPNQPLDAAHILYPNMK